MLGYAVMDLETTGFSPEKEQIVEFSVILFSPQGVEESVYTTLLNPGRSIPADAMRVHGITDRMVADAPTFAVVAAELYDRLANRILVGHNVVAFDLKFLTRAFERQGAAYAPPAVLDTLSLARTALPGLSSHRLEGLCKLASIKNTTAHRAESDARATWHLLCALALADVDDLTDLDKYNLPVVAHTIPDTLVASRPRPVEPDLSLPQTCTGEVVVFTGGCPEGYRSREDAGKEVLRRGGRVGSSVSKKTTVVFAGDNAGSKLDRARELGKPVYPHASFADFLSEGHAAPKTVAPTTLRRHTGEEQTITGQAPQKVQQVDSTSTKSSETVSTNQDTQSHTKDQSDMPGKFTKTQPTQLQATAAPGKVPVEGAPIHESKPPRAASSAHMPPPRSADIVAHPSTQRPIPAEYKAREVVAPAQSTKSPTSASGTASMPPPLVEAASTTRGAREAHTRMATASVVLGLLWLFWLGSIAAVILGHVALSRIRTSSSRKGRRRALAGLVLGYLGVGLMLLGIVGALVGA
jgi:DNA polymerase III epsilon subunit family exonuclease